MNQPIVLALFALAAFFPLPHTSGQAYAQQAAAAHAAPRINGFDVQPVARPTPGHELLFTLYGSAGGSATVQIGGATGSAALMETEAGVYEGTYTIRTRDRITAASAATANLRLGNSVASAILDEPLVGPPAAKRPAPVAAAATWPKIERFEVNAPPRLAVGEELIFTLTGSSGGTASARIDGVKGKLLLNEIRAGVYEGRYAIRSRDRVAADSPVTGTLRIGEQQASVLLGQTLVASAGSSSPAAQSAQATRSCVNCGVVEAINLVEVKGEGTFLGKIGGGVAGVILGSQIGSGKGTTAAQVAGAVGGAYAGNEIEKRMKTTSHYEVLVRLENGGAQTLSYATQPAFAVGAKVRIENGALIFL